jgi:hypothetical protein
VLIVGGRRIYGKVDQVGSTFVATTFAFLQFLPLFPTQSHIVLGDVSASDSWQVIPIPLHGKSIAAGYLRSWGILFSLISTCVLLGLLLSRVRSWSDLAGLALADLAALVPILLTALAFRGLGQLSVAEKAQRLVYARWTKHPVDVGIFDADQRGDMHRRIREFLANRVSTMTSTQGYRQAVQVIDDWRVMALEPGLKDREYLESALTLARIEASLAAGSQRSSLAALHRRIWDRLVKEYPDTLEVVHEAQALDGSALRRSLGLLPLAAMIALVGYNLVSNARGLMPHSEDRSHKTESAPSEEATREQMKRTLWSLRHEGGPARQGWERIRRDMELAPQNP